MKSIEDLFGKKDEPANAWDERGSIVPDIEWELPHEVLEGYMVYDPPEPEEDLVVAWLVGLNGSWRGKSIPLCKGQTTIGRSSAMDIVIPDRLVSRMHHAAIIHDSFNHASFIFRGEGRGILKLNGKTVLESEKLHHHDVLEIGSERFMFVPFCDDIFNWQDEESFCHP